MVTYGNSTASSFPRFFDSTINFDAEEADIEQWYIERFLTLCQTAFRDPSSYFTRFATLSTEEGSDLLLKEVCMRKETGTSKATPAVHLSFPFQKAMCKRQVWNDLQFLEEQGPQ